MRDEARPQQQGLAAARSAERSGPRKVSRMPRYSYRKVSTDKQGRSELGIEALRAAVASYLSGFGASLIAEFVEI